MGQLENTVKLGRCTKRSASLVIRLAIARTCTQDAVSVAHPASPPTGCRCRRRASAADMLQHSHFPWGGSDVCISMERWDLYPVYGAWRVRQQVREPITGDIMMKVVITTDKEC